METPLGSLLDFLSVVDRAVACLVKNPLPPPAVFLYLVSGVD
jgi:hypothetical protein